MAGPALSSASLLPSHKWRSHKALQLHPSWDQEWLNCVGQCCGFRTQTRLSCLLAKRDLCVWGSRPPSDGIWQLDWLV